MKEIVYAPRPASGESDGDDDTTVRIWLDDIICNQWNFVERNVEADLETSVKEILRYKIEGGNFSFDFLSSNMSSSFNLRNDPESYYSRIVAYIDSLKYEPALLGWYLPEEPEGHQWYPALYDSIRTWIMERDTAHPTMLVFFSKNSREVPSFLEGYSDSYDIAATDIYPVRYDGDTGDTTNRVFSVSNYYDLVPAGVEVGMERVRAYGKEALMFIPQAFDHTGTDVLPHSGEYRLPFHNEQRYMLYSALIHGARGLVWFYYPYVCFPERADGESTIYDPSYVDTVMIPLVDELSPLASILMEGEIIESFTCSDLALTGVDSAHSYRELLGHDINYIAREDSAGHMYLFAVNDSRVKRAWEAAAREPVTFNTGTSLLSDSVVVIGEDRMLAVTGCPNPANTQNCFTDTFGIFDVNLYYFPLPDDPRLPTLPDIVVNAGDHVEFSVWGSDPDHREYQLTYTARPLPEGASFERPGETSTGMSSGSHRAIPLTPFIFSWSPTEDQGSMEGEIYKVIFRVEDQNEGWDEETVRITVSSVTE